MSAEGQFKVLPGGRMPKSAPLPTSIEAEDYVIASVLLDETGQAWGLCQHVGLKPAAFSSPANQLVWEKIAEVWARGQVCDLAVLAEELKLSKQLDEIGGLAFLVQVTNRASTTAQTRYFAEQVKLLWEMRFGYKYALGFTEQIVAGMDREKFLKEAGELGQRLIRLGRKQAALSLGEIYDSVREEARARVEGTVDKSRWVRTGLAKFDEMAKPMGSRRADGFVVLAAGSGDGKTTAMCQIGAANLEDGKAVLMFSREVDTAGFVEKIVSARLTIDLNHLESLPKPDADKFYAECDRQRDAWAGKRLWCIQQEVSTPIFTVEDVCELARAHVHLHGVPALMMVDYLQIFGTRDKRLGSNRESVVAHVSHMLQALQRELGCVMIVGCQLNESGLKEMRKVERDEQGNVKHRLPNRGDLRESQAAYHDADRVIFLYRPPVDSMDQDQHIPGRTEKDIWWYQEKRRAGGICVAKTIMEQRFCRFVELGQKAPVGGQSPVVAAGPALPRGARVSRDEYRRNL
jgi:replicative DNA helicase